ncbi:MAG: crossover junction endodeoxyribonuclease RuvC [Propionibacterium sp.]|nr:crossover junction endodeoxyribonuclease RuvC [Propionibacterium sp.]
MGIDPGLTRCGVGVVEGGRHAHLVMAGVIRTPSDLDPARRLYALSRELTEQITALAPDVIAVERVFAQHNLSSVIGTAQAAGVAMMIGASLDIPVDTHTPSEVKAAITGSGRADKAQVGSMVARILRLTAAPKPADAADAVALAICQLWRGGARNRLQAAVEAAAR